MPRWISWLSDDLLECVIDVMVMIESRGYWPKGLGCSLVHLIPKPAGGRRPIGVLATFIRVWEAMRKPVIWRWRTAIARPYNWAAKGRSAEAGIWCQSIKDEVARGVGQHCGAVLFDLVKAYEMVKLDLIWHHGMKRRFPGRILRLVLESFAFTRYLVFRQAVAAGADTLSAMLAGSVFALDCLALLMTDMLDKLREVHPRLDQVLFVDDLSIHAREGSEEAVARALAEGTKDIIGVMEGEWGMKISRAGDGKAAGEKDKTIAIGSSAKVRHFLKRSVGRRGIHLRGRAAHLGIDYRVHWTKKGRVKK